MTTTAIQPRTPTPETPSGAAVARRSLGASRTRWREVLRHAPVPAAVLAVLIAGALAPSFTGDPGTRAVVWRAGLLVTGAPLVWGTLRGMLRGQFASDIVAAMAIVVAAVVGQPLAGLVVVLMQSGGEALERWAARRASQAVEALEEMAPRRAHVVRGGIVVDVDADEVAVGDAILVRPGELVPCDGVVVDGRSHVDASRLTGEPVPVLATAGAALRSGSANQEGPLTLRVTAVASESQYARIVQLVRSAQEQKAPLQRVADRYAVYFTPVAAAVALAAYIVGDAERALAVLVVATPCPLILAVPVAIIGGIGRAARAHVVVRHGGALEQIARVRAAVLDKTGTITIGTPLVHRVTTVGAWTEREVLGVAAALERGSGHLLARSVVAAAEGRGIDGPAAASIVEHAGRGVEGVVDDRPAVVGSASLIADRAPGAGAAARAAGSGEGLRAFVAVDGTLAGIIEFADALRPGVRDLLDELRSLGVARIELVSGDSTSHTLAMAREAGIDVARGEVSPEGKVEAVRRIASSVPVVMVGDGTNDAPALSAATVGIALASGGGGIAAEAADIILLTDDFGRVPGIVRIGQQTMRIAHQSIWFGLGLSGVAMFVAAAGFITPVAGALIQEAIDVAVILNAVRASGGGRRSA